MNTITDQIVKLINQTEIVAIATAGEKGPHLVATWGESIANLGVQDGHILLIPAGGYHQTEANLKANDSIELLVGSKQVQGKNGMGTGYRLVGTGKIVDNGEYLDLVKAKYPWARAALVVEVALAEQLL
jgi:hypothetical protein